MSALKSLLSMGKSTWLRQNVKLKYVYEGQVNDLNHSSDFKSSIYFAIANAHTYIYSRLLDLLLFKIKQKFVFLFMLFNMAHVPPGKKPSQENTVVLILALCTSFHQNKISEPSVDNDMEKTEPLRLES